MKRILPLSAPLVPFLCLSPIALASASADGTGGAPPAAARAASFAAFDARAKAGERLNVVFFGGSLTWSANASDPNRTGFRGLMADALESRYPAARFRFHDAAIGGTGSMLGVFRLDRDVLARKPDLVFLDFACNDGGENTDLAPTCCYESLLRRLSAEGVPVVQMLFTFRFWAEPVLAGEAPEKIHPRIVPYRRLAEAYGNGLGDLYVDSSLLSDLRSGKVSLDDVWPLDGAHPCDFGYRYFAEAGMRGFEHAVEAGLVSRMPETPVFGDVADVRRWTPGHAEGAEEKPHAESAECAEDNSHAESAEGAEFALPHGWSRKPTYRTSMWYDGLSSRWMDDVAVFSGTNRAPLEIRARANLVGVFGEANENALVCEVRTGDGERIAEFRGSHGAGQGSLFIWRSAILSGWERGEADERAFVFDPVPDGVGEFHIGSLCTATIIPAAPAADASTDSDSAAALEVLDHARGGGDHGKDVAL